MNWITQFQIGRNKMCVCMCVCVYSQKRTNDIENFRNEIMPNKIDIISTIVSSYYYFQHIFGCCCRCRRPAHSYPSTLFVFFFGCCFACALYRRYIEKKTSIWNERKRAKRTHTFSVVVVLMLLFTVDLLDISMNQSLCVVCLTSLPSQSGSMCAAHCAVCNISKSNTLNSNNVRSSGKKIHHKIVIRILKTHTNQLSSALTPTDSLKYVYFGWNTKRKKKNYMFREQTLKCRAKYRMKNIYAQHTSMWKQGKETKKW